MEKKEVKKKFVYFDLGKFQVSILGYIGINQKNFFFSS